MKSLKAQREALELDKAMGEKIRFLCAPMCVHSASAQTSKAPSIPRVGELLSHLCGENSSKFVKLSSYIRDQGG